MILDELLVKLGFVSDTKEVDKFKRSLDGVKKAATVFAAAVTGAGAAVGVFLKKNIEAVDASAKIARQLGLTVEQYQELEFAQQRAGGTTRDLDFSLRGLNKAISEARDGAGTAAQVFGRLGISTSANGQIKSTVDVLEEFADKIKGLSVARQTDFAQQLGITRSTLLLLQQGKVGIDQLRKEARDLGVVSGTNAKKAEEFADALRNVQQIIRVVSENIAVGLSPALTETLNNIAKLILQNKDLIKQGLTTFIKDTVKVLEILGRILFGVVRAIKFVTDAVGGFGTALQLLGIGAALAGFIKLIALVKDVREAFLAADIAAVILDASVLAIPLAIAATFAAAVLVIQDFITWIRGGNSEFGRLLGSFDSFKAKLSTMLASAEDFAHRFNQFFVDIAKRVATEFEKPIQIVEDALSSMFKSIESKFNSVIRLANKVPGVNISEFQTDAQRAQIPTGAPRLSPEQITALTQKTDVLNNVTQGAITNDASRVESTNNITINVNGSNMGGRELSKKIVDHINDAARQAHRNNASTIAI